MNNYMDFRENSAGYIQCPTCFQQYKKEDAHKCGNSLMSLNQSTGEIHVITNYLPVLERIAVALEQVVSQLARFRK